MLVACNQNVPSMVKFNGISSLGILRNFRAFWLVVVAVEFVGLR